MKKIISIFMALAITVCYVVPANVAVVEATEPEDMAVVTEETTETSETTEIPAADQVSIMFTNDMNSHMESNEITVHGQQQDYGGFARIKTVKDQLEKVYPGTYLVDAGNFSMGTAFQTIYRKEAPELVTMGEIGYDAATLGSNEFGHNVDALADMLDVAEKSGDDGDQLPVMTGLNIDWKKTLKDDKTKKSGQKLKDAFDNYGVEDYTIIDKNGVKVAIFGVIGDTATSSLPTAKVHFSDYVARAKQIVGEIKRNGEADIIVCLSNGGKGDGNFDSSDDARLAKEVKGIDMIVSGDNHSAFEKPEKVGSTLVVSCGESNENVGHVVFQKSKDGKFTLKDYKLIPLDENVEKDSEIQHMVNSYKSKINGEYFGDYGYSYDQVLAKNDIEFTPYEKFSGEQKEEPLGNLIADSYIYSVNKLEKGKKNQQPVDVAVITAASVRDSFNKGEITVADAFNVSSLGVGDDDSVGSPLVSVYLTGKELKHMAEVDASISPKNSSDRLYTSGLGYSINKYRIPLNRANNIHLINEDGKATGLNNDKLYRVVMGLDSCQRLSMVEDQSHGLLSIEPKDNKGNLIKDFEKAIVKDKDGNEIKEWCALATYMDSFDGGKVPKYYESAHDRKIIDNSLNPVKIFNQPNHIAIMIYAIALIPIVIIVGIILAIVKNRHRRRGYAKSIFSGSKNRSYNRVMSSRSRGVRPAKHKMNMSSKGKHSRKRRF